jgi:hypothetical protein
LARASPIPPSLHPVIRTVFGAIFKAGGRRRGKSKVRN